MDTCLFTNIFLFISLLMNFCDFRTIVWWHLDPLPSAPHSVDPAQLNELSYVINMAYKV